MKPNGEESSSNGPVILMSVLEKNLHAMLSDLSLIHSKAFLERFSALKMQCQLRAFWWLEKPDV